MVSLKIYNVMHIGSEIKCNPHIMEVVGFSNDSFDFNVLAKNVMLQMEQMKMKKNIN